VTPHDDDGNEGRTQLDADDVEEGEGVVEEAADGTEGEDVKSGHCVRCEVR